MTVGELRKALEQFDGAQEIEVLTAAQEDYDDGDEGFDLSFDLVAVSKWLDPDTAEEVVRLKITPAYAPLDED
jgi:hypothetical protein